MVAAADARNPLLAAATEVWRAFDLDDLIMPDTALSASVFARPGTKTFLDEIVYTLLADEALIDMRKVYEPAADLPTGLAALVSRYRATPRGALLARVARAHYSA